jgi:hypothetical protein
VRRLPLALVAALCCGCSFLDSTLGTDVDLAAIATLEPGATRRAEVLAAIGPPTDMQPHARGVAFLYEQVLIEERQFGINLEGLGNLVGIKQGALLKLSIGRTSTHRDAALLLFDEAGVLVAIGSREWDETLGKGGTVQFFVAVTPAVDYGQLREPPRQLIWGFELIEPLPRALNLRQRADLELRGTPAGSGQKTLELRRYSGPEKP